MLGNFSYCNPTKLYFGEDALQNLSTELKKYGDNVALVYGGGSIKKNGIYESVAGILKAEGKTVTEIAGVMPNPTIHKLYEGVEAARQNKVDFILAVGGGSVVDYAKALSVSVHCKDDPWEKYYARFEEPDCETVPVGAVLTMAGTGSEMNAGAVITYPEKKLKIGHVFADENIMPKFSILNPRYTMSLPKYQMTAGIYDIFNHICEQYFSGEDDNTSDYISEGLMKSVVYSSRIALKDMENYEARSNIMWAATWGLNTLGMTLSAVSMPYYRFIMPYGVKKFARFAVNVWGIQAEGKTDIQMAGEGLDAMEAWMKELGLAMNLSEVGVTPDMIEDIVNGTLIMEGGYKVLSKEDVRAVLNKAMA